MDDFSNKFVELLRYVPYIKYEKVKIQRFLSGVPQSYKDRIKFNETKIMDEAIRKAKYCYEQYKHWEEIWEGWKEKKKEKYEQRKKIFKPSQYII